MEIIKAINQTAAFLIEIVMLISSVYAGYHIAENVFLKYLLAILFPAIAIVAWSIYAAPKSTSRLKQPARLIFKTVLFLICAFLLYRTGKTTFAIAFAALAILNEVIALVLKD